MVTSKEKKIKLEFGISPPAGVRAAWGARALYSFRRVPKIDLLWDRQNIVGSEEDRRALSTWINEKGLGLLAAKLDQDFVGTATDKLVTVTDGEYTITANPRRSYGYLYIGAWR